MSIYASPFPLEPLVGFTGYHQLTGEGIGNGAFLAISTTQNYANGKVTDLKVTLAASLDGQTAHNYSDITLTSASGDSLDIVVRDNGAEAMTVHFDRIVGNGLTGTCSGRSADGTSFTGTSAFNSAPLELFAGRYLGMDGKSVVLEISADDAGTRIGYSDAPGELTNHPTFGYVPDMYVLSLNPAGEEKLPVSIMLGTGGALGLVAGITMPTGVTYAVTLPPTMPTA